jgi:hypothetical protein
MVTRKFEYDEVATEIRQVEAKLRGLKNRIEDLRDGCAHIWKFQGQANDYSETNWKKHFKCEICKSETFLLGPPVCEKCYGPTHLLATSDGKPVSFTSNNLKLKEQISDGSLSRIRGYTCENPSCNTITLVTVEGD